MLWRISAVRHCATHLFVVLLHAISPSPPGPPQGQREAEGSHGGVER